MANCFWQQPRLEQQTPNSLETCKTRRLSQRPALHYLHSNSRSRPCHHQMRTQSPTYTETFHTEIQHLREAAHNSGHDPVLHLAYQICLQDLQNKIRTAKEHEKIILQAKGKDWDFSRQLKTPTVAKLPAQIEGDADRSQWANHLHTYLSSLYSCTDTEATQIHELTWVILRNAHSTHSPQLHCHPNLLRDIIKDMADRKAPGPDGIPSQLIKHLSFHQITHLSTLFTTLANDMTFRSTHRPLIWEEALTIMLPKQAGATELAKYRPISLMSQIQKAYTKWLLIESLPILDKCLPETQSGYRRGRQAAETLYTVQRVIEVHLEWGTPVTLLKVDLQKAFDSISQSTILKQLLNTTLSPRLVLNLAREVLGNRVFPEIWGCTSSQPVLRRSGSKQGAPESGMMFVLALHHALEPLIDIWQQEGTGFPIEDDYLNHVSFVDDICLIGTTPLEVARMFEQLETHLATAGLKINKGKTEYLTSTTAHTDKLPGKNRNKEGIKILGRTFRLADNTDQEISRREQIAWSKFMRIRHILKAKTELQHRIKIYRACVVQSFLWAAQTWHITKKRAQKLRGIERRMLRSIIPLPQQYWQLPANTRNQIHNRIISQEIQNIKHESLDAVWIRRWGAWMGHLARLPKQRWASRLLVYRNIAWWRAQQKNPTGFRHVRSAGNLSRLENVLIRYHPQHEQWREHTLFRDRWNRSLQIFSARIREGKNHPNPDPAAKEAPRPQAKANTQNPNTRDRESKETSGPSGSTKKRTTTPPPSTSTSKISKTTHKPKPHPPTHKTWAQILDTPLLDLNLHRPNPSATGPQANDRQRARLHTRLGASQRAGPARATRATGQTQQQGEACSSTSSTGKHQQQQGISGCVDNGARGMACKALWRDSLTGSHGEGAEAHRPHPKGFSEAQGARTAPAASAARASTSGSTPRTQASGWSGPQVRRQQQQQ